MEHSSRLQSAYKICALSIAGFLFLSSSINLVLWHVAPMSAFSTYFSSIGFLFASFALCALFLPIQFPWHRILGVIIVIVGFIFVARHLYGWQFDLHHLFLVEKNTEMYRYSFDASPLNALAFVFGGLALTLFSKRRCALFCIVFVVILAFGCFCLGFAGFLNLFFPVENLLGLKDLPKSIPLVGISSMLLGIGIIVSRMYFDRLQGIDTKKWDFIVVFLFVSLLDTLIFLNLRQHENILSKGFVYLLLINGYVFALLMAGLVWLWRQAQTKNLELIQIQHELRANKEFLDFALSAGEMGAWNWNISEDTVEWNDRMYDLYRQKRNITKNYSFIVSCIHPQDRAAFENKVAETLKTHETMFLDYRIICPDGSIHALNAKGHLQCDEQNKPMRLSGLCWDVSVNKRNANFFEAELSILKALQEYKRLEDAFPTVLQLLLKPLECDLIACFRPDALQETLCYKAIASWELLDSQSGLEDQLHAHCFKKGEGIPGFVWSTHQSIWIPDMAADNRWSSFKGYEAAGLKGVLCFPLLIEQFFAGVIVAFYKYPLGDDYHAYIDWAQLVGSKLANFEMRKEAEEKWVESEKKFHTFLEYTPAFVWAIDTQYQITYSNQYIRELLGYNPQEVIGKSILSFLPDEMREKTEAFFADHIQQQSGWSKTMIPWRHKDGSLKWAESNASILADTHNHFIGLMGADRDITEKINLEKNKITFLSMLNHEMRTPLTSIRGALGLLKKEQSSLPSELVELIQIAYRNSERLTNIIDEIADFDKIASEPLAINFQQVQVSKLLIEAERVFTTIVQEKIVHLAVKDNSQKAIVYGDFDRLLQVLTNLLTNSYKVSPSDAWITLSAEKNDNIVSISVHDQGEGIPEAAKPYIFKQIVHEISVNVEHGGMGLGLLICKNIIEKHGGKIYFVSSKETGTTITFELPQWREHVPEAS